jgi:hypothetical protein
VNFTITPSHQLPVTWAEAQQAAQPLSGPARRLATHMMAEFFSQPIRGDKPALRLVVDNDRPDRKRTVI